MPNGLKNNMPKILVLGATGQVGRALVRALAPLGHVVSFDRGRADLTDLDRLGDSVGAASPDIIVNAAAYTAVDGAETDQQTAFTVNAKAPGLLAQIAAEIDALLIHYSTDYVFDGHKDGSYLEDDTTNPLSIYGQTKLQGEEAVWQSRCRHMIFRTSWVYSLYGHNFIKTMLRLAQERDTLNIVADQIGAPTSADLIADVTAHCISQILQKDNKAPLGIYHLTANGYTSWHGYAQYIIDKALDLGWPLLTMPESVHPITTQEYPVPAERPKNSRLSVTKLEKTFQLNLPPWQHHVDLLMKTLTLGKSYHAT